MTLKPASSCVLASAYPLRESQSPPLYANPFVRNVDIQHRHRFSTEAQTKIHPSPLNPSKGMFTLALCVYA